MVQKDCGGTAKQRHGLNQVAVGAPAGNQNAAKAKQWAAAIERALERRGDPTIDPDKPIARTPKAKALDDLADKFLSAVELPSTGIRGYQELGDRLDGKVSQPLEHSGDMIVQIAGSDANL
jgi:hypothetical protein